MNKKILAFILAPMILTACSSQSSDADGTAENTDTVSDYTIENIYEDFLADYESCKNNSYVNLDFSNCGALLPQFDICRSLTISTDPDKPDNITEWLEDFESYCQFFFDDYDPSNENFSSNSALITVQPDGKYAWYPNVYDYIEQIQDGSIDEVLGFLYRDFDNDKYLWWNYSTKFPHWVNKGEVFSIIKDETDRITSWYPYDMSNRYDIVASYLNDGTHNDETYHLLDGDVSVGEAVEYFENEYLSYFPCDFDEIYSDFDSTYSLKVTSVDVYNIQDDLYCYLFHFTTAWHGIPFYTVGTEYFVYQDTTYDYNAPLAQAIMIRKNDIDAIVNMTFPDITEVSEPIESFCSLESAVDIMSDTLTQYIKFEVQRIELVYKGSYNNNRTAAYVDPYWAFTAYNPNDNRYYCVYVNTVNGECSYMSYTLM